jgi:glycogen debranching enzyme
VPFGHYYGSIDSTPLFVLLAARYFERTGDDGTIRALWPNIEAALAWIDTYGDRDGDGFVEYYRKSANGLVNQGWKDSADSVMHANGELATGSVALCEVQAYVFAAKHGAAMLARHLGQPDRADALAGAAEKLRRNFEDRFWCEEIGTYALALDGDKSPAGCEAPMPGRRCSAASSAPSGPRSWPTA